METISAKTILTRTKSTSWFGCEYNMNLYRGCCHGCIYCDSRSDCYHIEEFGKVRAKENALAILRDELSRRVKTGVVSTGAMNDPYSPFEKKQALTRHALELLSAYGFGACIATKSDLVLRDRDVLQEIMRNAPALCKFTLTTTSDDLAARIEPHAPLPSARLQALEGLAREGVFCGVLLMPVLPFITDSRENIVAIVERAAEAGARFLYAGMGVTMRAGQREFFLNALDEAFPTEEYGTEYRRRFKSRYHCSSPHAKELWTVFTEACEKRGLLYSMQDIVRASRAPYRSEQLTFL